MRREGLYELTLPGAAARVEDWSQATEGMVVEARVTGHNKGGPGVRGQRAARASFRPAKCRSIAWRTLGQFVGQKFACVITEANPEKRNLVLSRRAVWSEKAEAKTNLLDQLAVGPGARRGGPQLARLRRVRRPGRGRWSGSHQPAQLGSHPPRQRGAGAGPEGQSQNSKDRILRPARSAWLFATWPKIPGAAQRRNSRRGSKAQGTVTRITEFGAFRAGTRAGH